MNKKRTITFLAITFLWSWIFWIIGLDYLKDGMTQETISKFLNFFFVGVYGPTIGAIITTIYYDGFPGVLKLLRKLLIWNIPIRNYAFIIFAPLIFVITGIGLYSFFIGAIGSFEPMAFVSIPTILWAGFYAGPLGEELGWRGFLLPEFQKSFPALTSSVLIGIIWFVWHIPLFRAPFGTLVSGEAITFIPVTTYFVLLLCISIMITWLVNKSKGSVLAAILFHLSINAGIALVFFPELNQDFKKVHLFSIVGMLLFTGILIAKNKLNTSTQEE